VFKREESTGLGGGLRKIICRAFTDPVCTPEQSCLATALAGPAARRLVVMVPSAGTRCGLSELESSLTSIGQSIAIAKTKNPDLNPVLLLLAQWAAPQTESECVANIKLTAEWWETQFETAFVGAAISPRSKILALNAAIPFLDRMDAEAVAWFDDDIIVSPECLSALLDAWSPQSNVVFGGAKVTDADTSTFSGWWARRKNRVEPVNQYPHGCAVLMSRKLFGKGIPPIYQSDDSYLLLRYLEPSQPDPFERLKVVVEARIVALAPNSYIAAARRIARNYRYTLRIAADAPTATVSFFFRRIVFFGLRFPTSLRSALQPRYWGLLFWHSLKFLFWLSLVLEILIRGVISRPRAASWFEAPYPEILNDPKSNDT